MNLFYPHIGIEELADMAEGRFIAQHGHRQLTHLAACRQCAGELSRLERVIGEMRADEMEDAPAYAFERARGLLRMKVSPPASVLKRVMAALKFDSLQSSRAFAVRSVAAAERQLLFSAGANDLHIQIKQVEEQWVVSGQVLGPCEGGEVELAGAKATTSTRLNELCEFALNAVPEGTYVLTVRMTDIELQIPDLNLG